MVYEHLVFRQLLFRYESVNGSAADVGSWHAAVIFDAHDRHSAGFPAGRQVSPIGKDLLII